MPILIQSLKHWPDDTFSTELVKELKSLKSSDLPLHQSSGRGGFVDDDSIQISLLRLHEEGDDIQATLGIFFTETIGGCNCHDDPLVENGYATILASINKNNAQISFSLTDD